MFNLLQSFTIKTSPYLVRTEEDWSQCRSISRAARRRKQGHKQNIIHKTVYMSYLDTATQTLYLHPFELAILRNLTEPNPNTMSR